MKKMYIMLLGVCLALVCSCNPFDDAHISDVVELAWNKDNVGIVSQNGGELKIPVYASGKVDVSLLEDVAWAELKTPVLHGDADIVISMKSNQGRRRSVKLAVELVGEGVMDTVLVRQEGTRAVLECSSPYKAVTDEENVVYELNTNLPGNQLKLESSYLMGDGGWTDNLLVEDVTMDKSVMNVDLQKNTTSGVRKVKISISHIDGWGEELMCNLYLTQADKDGNFGEEITFDEVRALLDAPGKIVVSEDLLLHAVVASDSQSRNMDENANISHDVVDSLESLRTAYLVNQEGNRGFRIKFGSHLQNDLKQGTLLQINLNGTEIEREDDPVRYTIRKIDGSNMVDSKSGTSADVPKNVKTIGGLNDEDMYTFASLQNTEFIFKYGTYADVYENYTLKSALHENPANPNNNGRMDGWATLLVDAEGKAIYAPVNMLCLWRRNPVPQGVGPTNGIIVHNKLPKVGNVGRYQIRVLDRSGFAQAEDGSSYEQYCIWDGKGKYIHSAYSNRNARYNHNQSKPTESIIPSSDILESDVPEDKVAAPVWPKGELFLENRVSANGAWPFNNGEYYCRHCLEDLGTIGENPGVQPLQGESETYYAFAAIVNVKGWYNFDSSGNVKLKEDGSADSNGIRYELSTKDLSGNGLLFSYDLAAGTIAISTSKTFPAHWCVEYSVDGGETYEYAHDLVTGEKYVHLRSLPWWDGTVNGTLYKTCAAAGLGFAQHAVLLPAEVLGKELLKVRLRPYDTKITTLPIAWDGDNETATILNSTSASNYFKIGSAKFSVLK